MSIINANHLETIFNDATIIHGFIIHSLAPGGHSVIAYYFTQKSQTKIAVSSNEISKNHQSQY